MTTEIKAGPELDRAVAEAIGDPFPRAHDWEHTGLSGYDLSFYRCVQCGDLDAQDFEPVYDPKDPCVRPYSTDLNAAFAAAERVGLFGDRRRVCHVLRRDDVTDLWVVTLPVCPDAWEDVSSEATPALAICAAILKLRETADA